MNQTVTSEENYGAGFPSLTVFSIWFGVIAVGVTAVTHTTVGARNQAWLEPFVLSIRLILLALLAASLIFLAAGRRQGIRTAALPLFVNLGVLAIIYLIPYPSLWEELGFRWQFGSYTAVANLVESGAIQPDENGVAWLPPRYRHLSADNGRIVILKENGTTAILFITQQFSPTQFAGYVYRSDNTPPQTGDFGGQWRVIQPKRPQWFYCISDG